MFESFKQLKEAGSWNHPKRLRKNKNWLAYRGKVEYHSFRDYTLCGGYDCLTGGVTVSGFSL
ncbi:MAG: hypothetical protein ACTSRF_16405 [Candidatus Freyarchaeota archaeon]